MAPDRLPLLSRPEAADYISRRLNISMSANALACKAHIGKGPRYVLFGGRRGCRGCMAFYTVADLDAWIDSQLFVPPSRHHAVSAAASS